MDEDQDVAARVGGREIGVDPGAGNAVPDAADPRLLVELRHALHDDVPRGIRLPFEEVPLGRLEPAGLVRLRDADVDRAVVHDRAVVDDAHLGAEPSRRRLAGAVVSIGRVPDGHGHVRHLRRHLDAGALGNLELHARLLSRPAEQQVWAEPSATAGEHRRGVPHRPVEHGLDRRLGSVLRARGRDWGSDHRGCAGRGLRLRLSDPVPERGRALDDAPRDIRGEILVDEGPHLARCEASGIPLEFAKQSVEPLREDGVTVADCGTKVITDLLEVLPDQVDLAHDAPLATTGMVTGYARAAFRVSGTSRIPDCSRRRWPHTWRGIECAHMDESTALDVTAARAVETGDRDRLLWTDADREWASRAAAEVVGEGASPEDFLGRRARLVLERIGPRQPAVPRTVRALRWRPWVGVVVVVAAFLLGLLVDRIGGGSSINLLAPPVFALLVWNVVVYLWLVVRAIVFRGGGPGPVRGLLIRLAALRTPLTRHRGGDAGEARRSILTALPADWARLAATLYSARAARVLHIAAAATALGVIAGLYTRGLAFEYRATWESTFLGAEQVRGLLAVTLAPGTWVTGIPVPDVAAIEAIRAPASENAATWMHLLAGTVAVVVVIPRVVLALVAGLIERRRSTRIALPLSEPYYQRLVSGYLGGAGRVRVVPYSYTVTPEAQAGLDAILSRAYGGAAATIDAPVAWGDDDALALLAEPDSGSGAAHAASGQQAVVALFSLAATPEREAHGAFLDALAAGAGAGAGHPLIALIDESGFLVRWPDDDARLADAPGGLARPRRRASRHPGVRRSRLARPRGDRGGPRRGIRPRLRRATAREGVVTGPDMTETAETEPVPGAIALSLISHTNAGKTTLARTLLGRDVGDVRDAPHVTIEATPFPLVQSPEGDALTLWDTPGFGDSVRLVRRLRQVGSPVGWFLSQVWDRYRDQPFFLTQLAVRNVAEQADVVLYLVNAAEEPADAGYLASELEVLEWVGKPVLVLLNQTGRPRERAVEAADEDRWRAALAATPHVREVLALDAFARCWVQEFTLFAAIGRALPQEKAPAFARLSQAWRDRRMDQFDAAMTALADPIAEAACDRAPLPGEPFATRLGGSIGLPNAARSEAQAQAARDLGDRLEAGLRAGTERLIAIHQLEGRAAGEVLQRVASDVHVDAPIDEGRAGVVSGVLSGAVTGLGADLLAGGLTFGAGMVAGAVIGALGGAGIARGVNVVRGRTESSLRWEEAFLDGLVTSALLRYLAIAHYGRGRGEWKESEYPPFWRQLVVDAVVANQTQLADVWARRAADGGCDRLERALQGLLSEMALGLLDALYPEALKPGR